MPVGMWKLAAKAAVAVLATGAMMGTAPAEAQAPAGNIGSNTPWWQTPQPGPFCPNWNVCIWPNTYWAGSGRSFYAITPVLPCQGVRFEGSHYQDNIISFKNLTSGSISFWDRAADGSYNYSRLGTFQPGEANAIYDFTNGRRADAFVFDPRGDCRILTLDHYTIWQESRVVLKVDPGGATARAVS
jgi:hypothetical protein